MSVFFIKDTPSKGFLDLKYHRPQNKKSYEFDLQGINKFSNFAMTFAIEVKSAQTTKLHLKTSLITQKDHQN